MKAAHADLQAGVAQRSFNRHAKLKVIKDVYELRGLANPGSTKTLTYHEFSVLVPRFNEALLRDRMASALGCVVTASATSPRKARTAS